MTAIAIIGAMDEEVAQTSCYTAVDFRIVPFAVFN